LLVGPGPASTTPPCGWSSPPPPTPPAGCFVQVAVRHVALPRSATAPHRIAIPTAQRSRAWAPSPCIASLPQKRAQPRCHQPTRLYITTPTRELVARGGRAYHASSSACALRRKTPPVLPTIASSFAARCCATHSPETRAQAHAGEPILINHYPPVSSGCAAPPFATAQPLRLSLVRDPRSPRFLSWAARRGVDETNAPSTDSI